MSDPGEYYTEKGNKVTRLTAAQARLEDILLLVDGDAWLKTLAGGLYHGIERRLKEARYTGD